MAPNNRSHPLRSPLLATTLLLLVLLSHSPPSTTAATPSPSPPTTLVCPLTGKPPQPPLQPPTRCLSAANLSCCTAYPCMDYQLALFQNSANATAILAAVSATLVPESQRTTLDPDFDTCSVTRRYIRGQHIVEQFVCGLACNPDGSQYLSVSGDTVKIKVCNTTAYDFYLNVRDVNYPGISGSLGTYESDFKAFTQLFFTLFAQSTGFFNKTLIDVVDIGTEPCFEFEGRPLPQYSGCCDPFDTPSYCPPQITNTTLYPRFTRILNRTVPAGCDSPLPAAPPAAQLSSSGSAPPPPPPKPAHRREALAHAWLLGLVAAALSTAAVALL